MERQPDERYVTIPTAAKYLDIGERQLRRWVEQGIVTGLRIPGGTKGYRIDLDEIDRVVEDHYFIRCSHPGCPATGALPPLWGGTGFNVYWCPEHFDDVHDGEPVGNPARAAGNTPRPVGSANTSVELPGETVEDDGTSPGRQDA